MFSGTNRDSITKKLKMQPQRYPSKEKKHYMLENTGIVQFKFKPVSKQKAEHKHGRRSKCSDILLRNHLTINLLYY